jgi:hypothetical protein
MFNVEKLALTDVLIGAPNRKKLIDSLHLKKGRSLRYKIALDYGAYGFTFWKE